MKTKVRALAFLMVTIFLVGTGYAQPRLSLEQKVYDAGQMAEKGGLVTHDFPFENTGDQPLVILDIQTSCSCTKADYSKKPVMPGEKGVITIKYDPKKQSGTVYKAIRILTNDPEKRHVITFQGEVVAGK